MSAPVLRRTDAAGRDAGAGTIALRADEVLAMLADLRATAAAPRGLVIDGDAVRRDRMIAALDRLGYRTFGAWTPLDAIAYLERADGRMVFAAIADDVVDGHPLRAYLTECHPEVHVVVIADRVRAGTIVEGDLGGSARTWRRPAPARDHGRARFQPDLLGMSPWTAPGFAHAARYPL